MSDRGGGGRSWVIESAGDVENSLFNFSLDNWWFRAVSDWPATDGVIEGGVSEPVVGVRPLLLPSLDVSLTSVEDFSVLKLAFDRRLRPLKDNMLGAMTADRAQAGLPRVGLGKVTSKKRRERLSVEFVCLCPEGSRDPTARLADSSVGLPT